MPEKFKPRGGDDAPNYYGEPTHMFLERRLVTDRTYKQYLEHFSLSEHQLEGKKILDIGAGLSDFTEKANEKFGDKGSIAVAVDPMYGSLGDDLREFEQNVQDAGMDLRSKQDIRKGIGAAYERAKGSPNKIAASHQDLPFADGSFDLIFAHNSITQYKDREVTRRAISEGARVMAENGEFRISPADLRFDLNNGILYVSTFDSPTDDSRKEAYEMRLPVAVDRQMFAILKEFEESGLNFYAIAKAPSGYRHPRARAMMGASFFLAIRKDDKIPEISGKSTLRKLSFRNSEDGVHVPSEKIEPKSDNNG